MTKVKNSVWGVFGQALKLYFGNFGSFSKYMAFPVFGQMLGIILILVASHFYSSNLPNWIVEGGILDNFPMIFLILFIITLPGLLILIKAFWDYLVAYGAVNSMVDNMLKSGKVYDFHAHTEVITRRSASFGLLWGLIAVLGLIGSFPLFWVIAGILFVYFVLVFQVFTFEPQKSPFECFQKSMTIINGNYAKTLGLIMLIGLLTYWIFPDIVQFLLDFSNITGALAIPFDSWTSQLPIASINKLLLQSPTAYQLTSLMLAKFFVVFFVNYIVTSFTLPLRVICWALWYKSLNKGEVKLDKRILDRAEKE